MKKVPLSWDNRACLRSCPPRVKATFRVKNSARRTRVAVSADGRGLVSQAGSVLLQEDDAGHPPGPGPVGGPGPLMTGAAGGSRPPQDRRGPSRRGRHSAGTAWLTLRCCGGSRSSRDRSCPTRAALHAADQPQPSQQPGRSEHEGPWNPTHPARRPGSRASPAPDNQPAERLRQHIACAKDRG
jgi:hypothetical protein